MAGAARVSGPGGSWTCARGLIGILLLAGTAALYAPVAGHDFVNLDDLRYVVQNPELTREPTPGSLLRHLWTPSGTGTWAPLTSISLHLGHALHGPEPAAFLLTNVALHALASLLLFAALSRMTGAIGRSAFVAAVFAVHPLHVESVAWVAERKDVLSGLFWMLGLYAYAGYAGAPRSWGRYLGVLLALVLGLLSKATLVTFPFALLLLDHWPLRRLRGSLREKLPMVALVGAASAVTFLVQRSLGHTSFGARIGFGARLANALESYVAYLADSVWPTGLAALYPHPYPGAPVEVWGAVAAAAALAGITALALALAGRLPYLVVGWLWYLGTLVPMIGLVQVGRQARADRYMYIPLVGLAIAAAWGSADLAARARWGRRALAAAAVAALAALSVGTRAQLGHWRDSIALFERMVAVTEDNAYAHERLAHELREAGRYGEAAEHYAAAIRLEPGNANHPFDLALNYQRSGDLEAAIEWYRRGLGVDPGRSRAHAYLASALIASDRYEEAGPHLAYLLSRNPRHAWLHERLALVLARLGRFEEAAEAAARAAELAEEQGDAELAGIARRRAEGYRRGEADPEPAAEDP